MPYDKATEDRALRKLYDDCEKYTAKPKPRNTEAGFGLLMALAVFLLFIGMLLSFGCQTVAGFGADIHDLAEGTRQQMRDDPPQPQR